MDGGCHYRAGVFRPTVHKINLVNTDWHFCHCSKMKEREEEGREEKEKGRPGGVRRGGGETGEERANYAKRNCTLETFQFLSVGCVLKKMQIPHLEGPSSPISWHLIRMQLSPIPYIQTIISDPSILGHE